MHRWNTVVGTGPPAGRLDGVALRRLSSCCPAILSSRTG